MALFDFLSSALKPVGDLVDELHTSDDERLAAKTKLLQIQADIMGKLYEYEKTLATEQGSTIRAEATSSSWMARNWRPMIMLMFGYIIAHNFIIAPLVNSFGYPLMTLEIVPDLWDLLKIGLGGYVVGRSAEKIVPATVAAIASMKTKEK